nr:MAG TPA: hypothetical protein [Bacteriophage sp.]
MVSHYLKRNRLYHTLSFKVHLQVCLSFHHATDALNS